MKIYLVKDVDDNIVKTYKRGQIPYYATLGAAKTAVKNWIRSKNKRLLRPDRLRFEDYVIVEFDLVEVQEHPL
jgi:hypothetical protein